MRRQKCRCRGLALLMLISVTVVGYAVLLALHQPLAQLELVHHVFHPPAADTTSPRERRLPTVDLDVESRSFCDGRLVTYGHQFARLTDVVVDRRHCQSDREGGEQIETVFNQPESVEYYRFDRGCFRLTCESEPPVTAGGKLSYTFVGNENHLNAWLHSMKLTRDGEVSAADVDTRRRLTLAVTRYEYANLYHTVTDWYNAFLLLCFFNETAESTDILLVDSHPRGNLDPVWRRLFRRTLRLSDLPSDRPTSFDRFVWGWLGYNSLITIYQDSPTPPLLEEFRSFFLSAYNLPVTGRPDCAGMRLSVLLIWRHDYVAHPRNPHGSVTRKIANEDELLRRLKSQLPPQTRVRGVQIDLYSMDEQLRMIADTDILIGMHGAGLTHTLFLRSTSALIELFPSYWSAGDHFVALATWRGLVYLRWINNDLTAERPDGRSTVVPPSVVSALVRSAIRRICPSTAQGSDEVPTDDDVSSRTSTHTRTSST